MAVGLELDDRKLDLDGFGIGQLRDFVRSVQIIKEQLSVVTRHSFPLVAFIIFLVLHTIVAIQASPGRDAFEQQYAVTSSLQNTPFFSHNGNGGAMRLGQITGINDFWDWFDQVFVPCAYSYQDSSRHSGCSHSLRPLGAAPRLRQLRVRSDSCQVPSARWERSGSSLRDFSLSDVEVARHGLFSSTLSLQSYVLECDPRRALFPAAEATAVVGEAGVEACGRTLPYLVPWSNFPRGQVGRMAGCYASIDQAGAEATGSYGPTAQNQSALFQSRWTWGSAEALGGLPLQGPLTGTRYPASGYAQQLHPNRSQAAAQGRVLRREGWLDLGTRLVAAEGLTYNPSTGLVSRYQVAVEFPAAGGAAVTVSVDSVTAAQLLAADAAAGRGGGTAAAVGSASAAGLVTGWDLALGIWACLGLLVEARALWILGPLWLEDGWRMARTANYLLCVAALGLLEAAAAGFPPAVGQFAMYPLAFAAAGQRRACVAWGVLLAWLRGLEQAAAAAEAVAAGRGGLPPAVAAAARRLRRPAAVIRASALPALQVGVVAVVSLLAVAPARRLLLLGGDALPSFDAAAPPEPAPSSALGSLRPVRGLPSPPGSDGSGEVDATATTVGLDLLWAAAGLPLLLRALFVAVTVRAALHVAAKEPPEAPLPSPPEPANNTPAPASGGGWLWRLVRRILRAGRVHPDDDKDYGPGVGSVRCSAVRGPRPGWVPATEGQIRRLELRADAVMALMPRVAPLS